MCGRFTRSLLELLVWQDHRVAEQKLFLSMMRSCGICFVHQKRADEDEDEAEHRRGAAAGRRHGAAPRRAHPSRQMNQLSGSAASVEVGRAKSSVTKMAGRPL